MINIIIIATTTNNKYYISGKIPHLLTALTTVGEFCLNDFDGLFCGDCPKLPRAGTASVHLALARVRSVPCGRILFEARNA